MNPERRMTSSRWLVACCALVLVASCSSEGESATTTTTTTVAPTTTVVTVTGTGWFDEVPPVGDERSRYEGADLMSDERVSGRVVVTLTELDRESLPYEMAGMYRLENDGGAWEGEWTGFIDGGFHYLEGEMIGSGDYEGLVYRATWEYYDTADLTAVGTIAPSP